MSRRMTARAIRTPRGKLADRSPRELLETVWHRWRVAQWNGRPVLTAFSRAAIARLDAAQPEWRRFGDLLDRQAIRGRDTRSTPLEFLRALFLQGRSPLDTPEPEDAEPLPAAA